MQSVADPIRPTQYQNWSLALAKETIEPLADVPGALINALHKLQEVFGYVDDEALPMLGKIFNVSRAEVHGVASFYHDFKRSKPGKYVVKVCQAEACQAMGSEELTDSIKEQLGVNFHETTEDGSITLEPVYCLGNCACSPNIMVDKQVHARMSSDKFKSLVSALKTGASDSASTNKGDK